MKNFSYDIKLKTKPIKEVYTAPGATGQRIDQIVLGPLGGILGVVSGATKSILVRITGTLRLGVAVIKNSFTGNATREFSSIFETQSSKLSTIKNKMAQYIFSDNDVFKNDWMFLTFAMAPISFPALMATNWLTMGKGEYDVGKDMFNFSQGLVRLAELKGIDLKLPNLPRKEDAGKTNTTTPPASQQSPAIASVGTPPAANPPPAASPPSQNSGREFVISMRKKVLAEADAPKTGDKEFERIMNSSDPNQLLAILSETKIGRELRRIGDSAKSFLIEELEGISKRASYALRPGKLFGSIADYLNYLASDKNVSELFPRRNAKALDQIVQNLRNLDNVAKNAGRFGNELFNEKDFAGSENPKEDRDATVKTLENSTNSLNQALEMALTNMRDEYILEAEKIEKYIDSHAPDVLGKEYSETSDVIQIKKIIKSFISDFEKRYGKKGSKLQNKIINVSTKPQQPEPSTGIPAASKPTDQSVGQTA